MEPIDILKTVKTILLIDWPGKDFVGKLCKAGFTVYGYSPGAFSLATASEEASGGILFTPCAAPPSIDIINIFRPEVEFDGIADQHILRLNPKAIWIQPPLTSIRAKVFAREHGMEFVQGVDISEVGKSVR